MNFKRLLFWAVIFCALALYVSFFENQEQTKEKPMETMDLTRVFTFSHEEIQKVQIIHEDKKVLVDKKAGRWEITSPPNISISNELTESLISSVMDTVVIKIVEENTGNLKQYGLDDTNIKVTVFLESKNPVTLLIGNNSPTGTSLYAMIEGGGRVFVTGSYILFSIKTFMENL